mgnify:CR=1 FL=1
MFTSCLVWVRSRKTIARLMASSCFGHPETSRIHAVHANAETVVDLFFGFAPLTDAHDVDLIENDAFFIANRFLVVADAVGLLLGRPIF